MADLRMIEILDLRSAEEHVLRTYKEQMSPNPKSVAYDPHYHDVVRFVVTRVIARFTAPAKAGGDLYALIEGAGIVGPITDAEPLHVGVEKRMRGLQRPNRVVDDHYVTLFPADIRNATATMCVTLNEFFETINDEERVSKKFKEITEWE